MSHAAAHVVQMPLWLARGKTLAEAKQALMAAIEHGARCPCCGRYAKMYKRKLHSEMAIFLLKLVRKYAADPRWYHIRELIDAVPKASTDGAYLVHWGLLKTGDTQDKATRGGLYRPTEKGTAFVRGRLSVPSHVHLYNNEVVGWSSRLVKIGDCLSSEFNYEELMEGVE